MRSTASSAVVEDPPLSAVPKEKKVRKRKARHRQREAGMGLKPTDEGCRGGAKQPVLLLKRADWTVAQKIAMRATVRQRAIENRLAKEQAAAKRPKTHHERDPNATFNLWQEGCSAVGIPLNGQLIPGGFHAPSTGESPEIGRRGLGQWIGFTETSAGPECGGSEVGVRDYNGIAGAPSIFD